MHRPFCELVQPLVVPLWLMLPALCGCADDGSPVGPRTDWEIEDAGARGFRDSGSLAPEACHVSFSPRHHPPGFADATLHGMEAKLQKQDCRLCHASELQGCGAALGCDSCHVEGWRKDCTYCHGGEEDDSGAPPGDLLRNKPASEASFRVHTSHVQGSLHVGFACSACHAQPEDVLSPGHVFDSSPGMAEVSFAEGLSRGGIYAGQGRCDNLYCHGNGREPGGITHTEAPVGCGSCHGYLDTPENLSPSHGPHFRPVFPWLEPVQSCSTCHAIDIEPAGDGRPSITGGLDLHVDGQISLRFAADPTTGERIETLVLPDGNRRCNGSCHGRRPQPLRHG